jgi:hypothetical protein
MLLFLWYDMSAACIWTVSFQHRWYMFGTRFFITCRVQVDTCCLRLGYVVGRAG